MKSKYIKVVNSVVDFSSIQETIEILKFSDYSDAGDLSVLDLSSFKQLKLFQCDDRCFVTVTRFVIDGLNRLESVKIGKKSFTLSKNRWAERKNREFHLTNCSSLVSLEIGPYSFSDYYVFELKGLPSLKSIIIGDAYDGFSFHYAPIVDFNSD